MCQGNLDSSKNQSLSVVAGIATETTSNAPRTRLSIVAATISFPLAANATTHPTNIKAMKCKINIPFSNQIYVLKWPDQNARYLSVTTINNLSLSPRTHLSSKKPPTTVAGVDHGETRNPVPTRCAIVFTACRQNQLLAKRSPDLDARSEYSSSKSPRIDSASSVGANRLTSQRAMRGG